ncbi:hypothetical protein CHS0354_019811 [Potamilus streckersoni]|uniref:Uncharacterized protein n=1 Tax=Potamilus streckersoni TaxID=2493646 RepID=A0AAE0SV61_9BIVA|nr:hypothetical protein CHS0354_019811 [Potamilus streckersoni]
MEEGCERFRSKTNSGSEIVWLKDVTEIFHTQKRLFGDHDLPDHLTFHVRRRSGVLTLKLKRNYEIDPDADIYFVEGTKDGRSILSKTKTLECEAVAYYQDLDNRAYMTVRCIKSLNQQCERIINGNLQIGDRSYELRPAVTGDTPANILKVTDSISRIYLLLDQTYLQQEKLVENKDAYKVYETHVPCKHKTPLRSFTKQKVKNLYHFPDDMVSSRGTPGENNYW